MHPFLAEFVFLHLFSVLSSIHICTSASSQLSLLSWGPLLSLPLSVVLSTGSLQVPMSAIVFDACLPTPLSQRLFPADV